MLISELIRMGAAGCLIASIDRFVQFPAYHTPPRNATPEELTIWQDQINKVFDVTGGGNAFMGGFCIGLTSQRNKDIVKNDFADVEIAAIYGTVSASFAIEQVGMPKLSYHLEDGKEL